MIGLPEATRDDTNRGIRKIKAPAPEGIILLRDPCFLPCKFILPMITTEDCFGERLPMFVSKFPLSLDLLETSPNGLIACFYSSRCQSRIARTLPMDQKPDCRPYWEKDDPSMPLPFDLTDIVSELRGQLLEAKP
jgi:hypothetical protein